MQMTSIYLIRHGETDWNLQGRIQGREDIPLNAHGLRQAEDAARLLMGCGCRAVYSSPLKRALVTAGAIARFLGIGDVIVLPEFIERDFGRVSGLTPEERKKLKQAGAETGAEPLEALKARGLAACGEIARARPGQSVAVVSHGALINAILSAVSGGEYGTGKTVLFNGGVSLLRGEEGRWTVPYYNRALRPPEHPPTDIFTI